MKKKIESKKIDYSNGKYEGNLMNGKPQNYGIWESNDGTMIYKGTWEDGKYDGKGIFINKKTNKTYEGNFMNGKYHGNGKLKMSQGIFEGEWYEGKSIGKGIITKDGKKYFGKLNRKTNEILIEYEMVKPNTGDEGKKTTNKKEEEMKIKNFLDLFDFKNIKTHIEEFEKQKKEYTDWKENQKKKNYLTREIGDTEWYELNNTFLIKLQKKMEEIIDKLDTKEASIKIYEKEIKKKNEDSADFVENYKILEKKLEEMLELMGKNLKEINAFGKELDEKLEKKKEIKAKKKKNKKEQKKNHWNKKKN